MSAEAVRIAIVEDHVLVREALMHEVGALGHEVVVVGATLAAVDGRQDIDLLLLDLDLADGLVDPDSVAGLVRSDVQVIIVSALSNPAHVRALIGTGVVGVVAKQDGLADLASAIASAVRQEPWMSPLLAQAMAADDASNRPTLSDKELQALRLYACGLKLDSVARRMGISSSTAKQYIDRVRAKYEQAGHSARTKTELYQAGVEDGFITPPARERRRSALLPDD